MASASVSKKAAAPKARTLTRAQKAEIDRKFREVVAKNPNAPGLPMVRALTELAKLGPYNFKKRASK